MPTRPSIDALMREAAALRAAGRVPEAIAAYQRLLAARPELPNSWYNLAWLQRQAQLHEAALASYQKALDHGVAQAEEVHLNRGVIYADHLRRTDDAERELHAALALNPRYVPALLNLGNLHEDRGQRAQARQFYERALAVDPRCHEALARLAGLRTVATADDALVQRLRHVLAEPDCSAADRASLGFALGRLLDACGAHDAAFAAYARANRDSRDSAGPKAPHYDRQAQEQLVDAIIAAFPVRAAAVDHGANTRPPPVFVCGMFRSGSTLAEQVLASHPRVTAGGELDLLPGLVARSLTPFPAALGRLGAAQLATLASAYLDRLAALFPGADLVTDKRPDNHLYIGLIKTLFPAARIVHTRRHAVDNCLSIHFLHLAHSQAYALDLEDTAHHYRQYRRLMAHWKALYGDDILDLDYDTLVRAPRPAIASLLHFCGLDWDEGCMAFHRSPAAVRTASVWQVREPLYTRASGRWRHYRAHLGPLLAALGDQCPADAADAADAATGG